MLLCQDELGWEIGEVVEIQPQRDAWSADSALWGTSSPVAAPLLQTSPVSPFDPCRVLPRAVDEHFG